MFDWYIDALDRAADCIMRSRSRWSTLAGWLSLFFLGLVVIVVIAGTILLGIELGRVIVGWMHGVFSFILMGFVIGSDDGRLDR